MIMKQTRLNAIFVTHSTRVFGPPNALVHYLADRQADFLYIDHPLDYEPDRQSRLEIWRQGKKVAEAQFPNWLGWAPINYFKDLVVTLWILLRYARGQHYDYLFGFDSLSCLAGLWLRPWLKINHYVAYNADYSTNRFSSQLLNRLYLWADSYTMRRVDTIWCVTERIAAIRRQTRSANEVIVVPNGVDLQAVRANGSHDKGLVFIGNLTREKGLDVLIRAMQSVTDARLTIYGDGATRPQLEELARQLDVLDRIIFAGQLTNTEILQRLADYQAGIALYRDSESYVYFSDPLKVKEYLAAGVPVIMTGVPEVAEAIQQAEAGIVINSDDQLTKAIETVLAKGKVMQRAAQSLAKTYGWDTLFTHAFRQMEKK